AGGVATQARERFETLGSVAGRRMRNSPVFPEIEEIAEAPSDLAAWAFAIKHFGDTFRHGMVGEQKTEEGESAGFIFTGSIDSPAQASANLCLALDVETTDVVDELYRSKTRNSGAGGHLKKARGFLDDSP